jgi:hypothetical protein
MRGQKKCLPGPLFRNPFHLIKDATRPDDSHPVFRSTLSFPHPGLGGFFGDRFVRENADPDSACPLDKSGHGNSCSFDLTGSQPTALYGLEPKVTEVKRVSTGGDSSPLSFLLFPIFRFLRHQHNTSSSKEESNDGRLEYWPDKNISAFLTLFHYSMIPEESLSQAALSSPSFVGKTSPLKIQTFTPMIP